MKRFRLSAWTYVIFLLVRLNFDKLYGASDITTYDTVYTIEMYLETYGGFAGDQSFISKFGLEIRDQMLLDVIQ